MPAWGSELTIDVNALFITAFGALLGALMAGLLRYGASRRERQVNLTVTLHAEFHAPAFAELRITAHDALQRLGGGVPQAYARAEAHEKQAIYAVLHYFERVALLARTKVVNRALLRRFLRQYVGWWRPLLCGEGKAYADAMDHPEWGETLAEIDWLFDLVTKDPDKGRS